MAEHSHSDQCWDEDGWGDNRSRGRWDHNRSRGRWDHNRSRGGRKDVDDGGGQWTHMESATEAEHNGLKWVNHGGITPICKAPMDLDDASEYADSVVAGIPSVQSLRQHLSTETPVSYTHLRAHET